MIHALAITGPTASGKTALSLSVAKKLNCEIICCDSMQIYKGMDIGTAKATEEERAAVPHHMLDFLDPDDDFSAQAYKTMALECARQIANRGKTPLFVGGTGLYLTTLMRSDTEEVPRSDELYRKRIEDTLKTEEDKIRLWQRLKSIDPISADLIHYNNTRRVIRAIEIYDSTGKPKSYFDELSRLPSKDICIKHVTLDFHDRDNLYKRVDLRVDEMIRSGLEKEVDALLAKGYLQGRSTAAQAIGYKEIIAAKKCGAPIDSAISEIKQATRNYAKRQLTWFRHDDTATAIFADDESGKMKPTEKIIDESLLVFNTDK